MTARRLSSALFLAFLLLCTLSAVFPAPWRGLALLSGVLCALGALVAAGAET